MPYGIVNDRKRALTADYVGRMTKRGFKGRILRPDRKARDCKANTINNFQLIIGPDSVKTSLPPQQEIETFIQELPFSSAVDWDIGDDRITSPTGFFDPQPHNPNDPYRSKILQRPSTKTSQGTTSNELMATWSDSKWPMYLERIVNQEDVGCDSCESCHKAEVGWRCLDCLGCPRLCKDCCRVDHRRAPFHKVEAWSGGHWRPAWLWHVGVAICLGHGQTPCPKYEASLDQLEDHLISVNPLNVEDDNAFCAKPKKRTIGCGDVVCFLHTNGFHYLPVYPCWCSEAPPDDVQYLDRSFYPASWKSVQTALTFSVLHQFNLFKLHGHISTETYLEILCRFTNDLFPSHAPDRRATLARVWTQWSYLNMLRRNGFARLTLGEKPEKGALAPLCPACPHPGVNLPPKWKDDPRTWLYRRYLVADGNFVLDHLSMKREGQRLINGAAYTTEPVRYAKHLAATKEPRETSSCAMLRAVSYRNVYKKGYDVTGIVAIACARHGCFAPGGVVDLQKGERQKNVDYALSESLQLTKAMDTPGGLLAYDVNCQFCIRVRKRFKEGPYLSLDRNFPLDFVIGLFHVHGHNDECLARFAPTYFPGAGATSGEILESLWSQVNGAARTTRHMTLGRRADTLDALMWYNNRRKLEGLADALPKQLKKAKMEVVEAEKHLDGVKQSMNKADQEEWNRQLEKAIRERKGHNTSMDIYLVQTPPVVPMKTVKAQLITKETNTARVRQGVAEWVASGIEVQLAQLDHRALLRRALDPSVSKSVDIARKGQTLARRVTAVYDAARELFPKVDFPSVEGRQWTKDEVEICICEDECSCAELEELPMGREPSLDLSSAELRPVPLPSSFDVKPKGWVRVSKLEEDLWVAQAEEALEALRVDIGHKSFLYVENRDWATGKRERTRAYDRINAVEANMRTHIKRYECARWALGRLGVVDKYPQFLPLSRADTKAVTAVFNPNKRGERNAGMSWIWRRHGADIDSEMEPTLEGKSSGSVKAKEDNEYLKEIYRVKWLRARARIDRWREEVMYLESEMSWYVSFMGFQARLCEEMAEANLKFGPRRASHELREADMWTRLAREGRIKFGWEKRPKMDMTQNEGKLNSEVVETDNEGAGDGSDVE